MPVLYRTNQIFDSAAKASRKPHYSSDFRLGYVLFVCLYHSQFNTSLLCKLLLCKTGNLSMSLQRRAIAFPFYDCE